MTTRHPMRQRMLDVFGVERLYDFRGPAWTRIELIPDATVPEYTPFPFSPSARLLRELDTARAVVGAMFATSKALTIEFGWASGAATDEVPPFERLEQLGVEIPPEPASSWRVDPSEPDDYWAHQQFTTIPATQDALAPWLVGACGGFQDRGLINLSVGLIDFERGLALEFYNAKGMTPMAARPEALAPLYWRFRDWVREAEIERCDALFSPWRRAD